MSGRRTVAAMLATAALAGSAAVALASHPKVDPSTVPVGFFTAHSQVNGIPVSAVRKLLKNGRADAFVEHSRLQPGQATGFVTHPGVVFVMVARGTVTNETPAGDDCRSKAFVQDRGFTTRSGQAHRMTAGSEGAELFLFYLAPRLTGPTQKVAATPAPCA
jgi:hypothetical protein